MQAISAGELDVTCLAVRNVAGEVRRRLEYRLSVWRLPRLVPDACVVAGELIANACDATPGAEIRIRFMREPAAVLLAVWDASDRMPLVQPIQELTLENLDLSPEHFDDNHGWGLPLVQALATECGVDRTIPTGKWVWARLAVPV